MGFTALSTILLSGLMLSMSLPASAKSEWVNENGWAKPIYFSRIERSQKFSQKFSSPQHTLTSAQAAEFRTNAEREAYDSDKNLAGRGRLHSHYMMLDYHAELSGAPIDPVYSKVDGRDVFSFQDDIEVKSQFIAFSSQATDAVNTELEMFDLVLRNNLGRIVYEKSSPAMLLRFSHQGQDLKMQVGDSLRSEIYDLIVKRGGAVPDLEALITLNVQGEGTTRFWLNAQETSAFLRLREVRPPQSLLTRFMRACSMLLISK